MKKFSIRSIISIILGLLLFALNWIIEDYLEPIVLLGAIFLFIGCIFSFIAISKKEIGSLKFISVASVFMILYLIIWFEPIQVIRIITWIKNIS